MDLFDFLKTLIGIKIVKNIATKKYHLPGVLFCVLNGTLLVFLRFHSNSDAMENFTQKEVHIRAAVWIVLIVCRIGYPVLILTGCVHQWKWNIGYIENKKKLTKFLVLKDTFNNRLEVELATSKNQMALSIFIIVFVSIITNLFFDESYTNVGVLAVIYKSYETFYFRFLYFLNVSEVCLNLRNLTKCWKAFSKIISNLKDEL